MNTILFVLVCFSVLLLGCTGSYGNTSIPSDEKEVATVKSTASPEAMVKKSTYAPFRKAEYEEAKAGGRVVYLNFFANWCPICRAEKPNLDATLSSLPYENVAAFIVNYKDSETDADEEALAREFGITYQHTTVILGTDGTQKFKSLSPLSKNEILTELQKAGAV